MIQRPIYLVSITPSKDSGIIHLPLLGTKWLFPAIDFTKSDGIIFTSKTGVEALERIDPEWKKLPVVCVGKATERRALELGAAVLATAEGYGEGLYDAIRLQDTSRRWLYVRPKTVASDFAARLRQAGITVDEAVVYETVCLAENINTAIEDNAVLIFTSPSALACFQKRFAVLPGHSVVVIGTTTAKSLCGHSVHLAAEPTVAACVALAKQLAKEHP